MFGVSVTPCPIAVTRYGFVGGDKSVASRNVSYVSFLLSIHVSIYLFPVLTIAQHRQIKVKIMYHVHVDDEVVEEMFSAISQICLSVCLSACLPVCLFFCLSVCLNVCLSACLSECMSVCLRSIL